MNVYNRAVRLPFLTGSLVPVFLAAGQALIQKTHMALGVLRLTGILIGHFSGRA